VAHSANPSAFSLRPIHQPELRTKVALATSSLRPSTLTQRETLGLIRQIMDSVCKPACR
jgi:LysR family nitrogen assimilation transcriptional regulator